MGEEKAPLLGNSVTTGLPKVSFLRRRRQLWTRLTLQLRDLTPRNLLVMSVFVGITSGLISLLYTYLLTQLLRLVWVFIPNKLILPGLELAHSRLSWPAPQNTAWVYILLIGPLLGALSGLGHKLLGYPGDIPNALDNVHKLGYIPSAQAPSMFVVSSLSIASGASVGPEAPVLAVCAAAISWFSRVVMGQRGRMLRSCTLMAMASGLTSLFGVTLGGAIFAFEVLHTNGLQYFEALPYAVFSSILCLAIHRGLWNMEPFGAIWKFDDKLEVVDSRHIAVGIVLGFLGILLTQVFRVVFIGIRRLWDWLGLIDSRRPIIAGLVGGMLVGIIGVFLPATMFWSEFELASVGDTDVPLAHIWPKEGFWGFTPFRKDKYTPLLWAVIGIVKMITISISVASGLRGGFIFPLMFSGACIGECLASIPGIPWWSTAVPSSLPALALAGALTTGITRSPFSCALILSTLAGIPQAAAPTLMACLVVFFGTMHKPFFLTQRDRMDIAFLDLDREDTLDSVAFTVEDSQENSSQTSGDNIDTGMKNLGTDDCLLGIDAGVQSAPDVV